MHLSKRCTVPLWTAGAAREADEGQAASGESADAVATANEEMTTAGVARVIGCSASLVKKDALYGLRPRKS